MARKTTDTGASEATIQSAIMHTLGPRRDMVVHRNNVGVALHTDRNGRTQHVRYGVGGTGAPDLLVEVLVAGGPGTGRPGVWAAVWLECKTYDGAIRPEQTVWHEAARSRGRHAYIVRSVEDALAAVAEVQRNATATATEGAPSR